MKLLILGGTGGTGKHLVEMALDAGHDVTPIVRDPSAVTTKHPKLALAKGRATVEADLEPLVAGKDAVLSAIGPRSAKEPVCSDAARALVSAMKKHGVNRVVWLSASGVGDSRPAVTKASWIFGNVIIPLFLKSAYADHFAAEETLRGSGTDWTILRPLQLVDAPTGRAATATPHDEKPGGTKIARKDVAAFMLKELADRAWIGKAPMLWA